MNDVKVKWPLVIEAQLVPYLNYIDLGNYTMYRMCVFKTIFPRKGMFVAIENRDSYFFMINKWLHKDYVAEKLSISGDSGQVADFLNAQLGFDGEQQGYYYDEIINGVKPHGAIGEMQAMPWKPDIV